MGNSNSCEARIDEELKSRIIDLKEAMQSDSKRAEYFEQILSLDETTVYRVVLSWGGPSDAFNVSIGANHKIESVSYSFLDWFDGAERELSGDNLVLARDVFGFLEERHMEHSRREEINSFHEHGMQNKASERSRDR